MDRSLNKIWLPPMPRQFAKTLATIDDVKTMQNFLRDLLTDKEIIEISARLQAARMLQDGARYTDVIEKTKLSSRTVARISAWLQKGAGGYKAAAAQHHTASKPRLRAV